VLFALVLFELIENERCKFKTYYSMRLIKVITTVLVTLLFVGCGPTPADYGETTEAFVGHIVQNGKPVTLPEGARLDVTQNSTYHKFGIPLNSDGTFKIGWMPIGKYSVELIWIREAATGQSSQQRYSVPNELVIEKETKPYEVELGKKWKR
jgi:hypothetical protein